MLVFFKKYESFIFGMFMIAYGLYSVDLSVMLYVGVVIIFYNGMHREADKKIEELEDKINNIEKQIE